MGTCGYLQVYDRVLIGYQLGIHKGTSVLLCNYRVVTRYLKAFEVDFESVLFLE
jgi:hypothetical protein